MGGRIKTLLSKGTTAGAEIAVITGSAVFGGLCAVHSAGGPGNITIYDSVAANAAAVVAYVQVTAAAGPVTLMFPYPIECTTGICSTAGGAVDYVVYYR